MDNIQITSECVKTISNVGHSVYVNICNGSQSVVPWDAFDWFAFGILVSVLVMLVVLSYRELF